MAMFMALPINLAALPAAIRPPANFFFITAPAFLARSSILLKTPPILLPVVFAFISVLARPPPILRAISIPTSLKIPFVTFPLSAYCFSAEAKAFLRLVLSGPFISPAAALASTGDVAPAFTALPAPDFNSFAPSALREAAACLVSSISWLYFSKALSASAAFVT